jgi:hypothetical protein
MKLYQLFSILFLSLLSTVATAQSMRCDLGKIQEDSLFTPYAGGSITIDLESLVTTMEGAPDKALPSLALISKDTVSTYMVPRNLCEPTRETVMENGVLRLEIFHFGDCLHHLPGSGRLGYARAWLEIDHEFQSGRYSEIFLTPTGDVPEAYANFEHCDVN